MKAFYYKITGGHFRYDGILVVAAKNGTIARKKAKRFIFIENLKRRQRRYQKKEKSWMTDFELGPCIKTRFLREDVPRVVWFDA